jgi:D-sedoheptulose 7-phosphate isomerase
MSTESSYVESFLSESIEIISQLDREAIDTCAALLRSVKDRGGRLFFAGSGGGAGHASHATADFRKIAGIESYSVTDNVSELTARINDEGWETAYEMWLKGSRMNPNDALFVFSVGGGDAEKEISTNLVRAIDHAKPVGAIVVGVAGRDGGHLLRTADAVILVPTIDPKNVTTQTEGFQALMWHLLVGHPALDGAIPKWESVTL